MAIPVRPRVSSVITDSSKYNRVPYIFNNGPITSTAQSFSGGASGFFNGIAAFYQYTGMSLTGDCTLEALIYPLSSNDMNLGFSSLSENIDIFRINEGAPGNITVRISPTQSVGPVAGGITPNTWHRLRFTRANGHGRIFVDDVQKGPTNTNMQGTFSWNQFGANFNSQGNWYRQFYGFYDEVRITDNIARGAPSGFPFSSSGDPYFDDVLLLLHLDSAASIPAWVSTIEQNTTIKMDQVKTLRLLVEDPDKVKNELKEFTTLCRSLGIKLYNNKNGYLEMQPHQNWISMFTARDLTSLI
jgi:hypothetical protein